MTRRVTLDPLASEALDRLGREICREGTKARPNEIVSAIVYGATAPQAAGMLPFFVRARARRRESGTQS